jgi:hypothetical protein
LAPNPDGGVGTGFIGGVPAKEIDSDGSLFQGIHPAIEGDDVTEKLAGALPGAKMFASAGSFQFFGDGLMAAGSVFEAFRQPRHGSQGRSPFLSHWPVSPSIRITILCENNLNE